MSWEKNRKISHRFRNHIAGKTWQKDFWVDILVIRSPEPRSLGWAVSFNRPKVYQFFLVVQGWIEQTELHCWQNIQCWWKWADGSSQTKKSVGSSGR